MIRRILARTGPLDVLALAAQAVAMGDDVHVRTQAATNLLIREWLPHLAELGGPDTAAFARFLAGNHLFFLTLAMGAARSLTEWAAQVPESSIVTTMARNGTTFGIRLAPASGSSPRRRRSAMRSTTQARGRRPALRTSGTARFLSCPGWARRPRPARTAVAKLLGGQMREARPYPAACRGVLGTVDQVQIPVLDNIGTPLGVDVRKVVELPSPPAVTTGILHRSAGTGQVGAGVAEAPLGVSRTRWPTLTAG